MSSLQTLKNVQRAQSGGKEDAPKGFPALLDKWKGEIARALPKHINPDRMARLALTAFRQTPKLAECDPRSVFAAVIQSSQLGLEVGLMGEAHLVPYGNQCQLIPGYTGLMKLARNSGMIQDIYAHEVRLNDKFTLKLGLERSLEHEPLTAPGGFPASDEERGEAVGFYAVAVFKDGSRTFVAMSRKEVEGIRDKSRGYQAGKRYKKESPWDTDFVAMALKTAIRRLCKFLPKSPELATALAMDAMAEQGKSQNLDLNDVIEGNYAPVTDDEPGEEKEGGQQAEAETSTGGTSSRGQAPKDEGQRRKPEQHTELEAAIEAMKKVATVEALDEVYIRAENDLEGSDLEEALRFYKQRKQEIGDLF
jgi:recombinase, phage RecT family